MTDKPPSQVHRPPPPDGFLTWLDYAVSRMDTRDPYHEQFLLSDEPLKTWFDRASMHSAALAELDVLRAVSGVPDTFPGLYRRNIEADAKPTGGA